MMRVMQYPAALVLYLTLIASPVAAQVAREQLLIYHIYVYLGAVPVQKELGLSPDEVQQISKQRATYLSSRRHLPRDVSLLVRSSPRARPQQPLVLEQDRQAENFLAEMLSEKQQARMVQIVLQQLASDPDRRMVEEVLGALDFTSQQREELTSGRKKFLTILTPTQLETWNARAGLPFKPVLDRKTLYIEGKPAQPGTSPFGPLLLGGMTNAPAQITLLNSPVFCKHLELTANQRNRIQLAIRAWRTTTGGLIPLPLSELQKKRDQATGVFDAVVLTILGANQQNRLEQVLLQGEITNLEEVGVFMNPRVVRKLALTRDQLASRDRLLAERRDELARVFLASGHVATVARKVEAVNQKSQERLFGLLATAQKVQFKNLLGPAYQDPAGTSGALELRAASSAGAVPSRVQYLPPPLLVFESRFVAPNNLAEVLKLSEEHKKDGLLCAR